MQRHPKTRVGRWGWGGDPQELAGRAGLGRPCSVRPSVRGSRAGGRLGESSSPGGRGRCSRGPGAGRRRPCGSGCPPGGRRGPELAAAGNEWGGPETGGAGEVALPGPPRASVLTHLRDVMFLLRGLGWAADPLPRPQAPRGPVSSARERTGRPSSRPRADDLPSPRQASRPRGSRTQLQPPPAGPLRRAPLRLLLLLLLPALLRRRRRLMTSSTRRDATHGGATSGFRETAPLRTAPRALSPGNGGSEALTATLLPTSGKGGARGASWEDFVIRSPGETR